MNLPSASPTDQCFTPELPMARNGVLAGGNWIVDRPKIIDVYPAQDALANILQETSGNGGSPYNLLLDLARLEAPFPLEAVGLVGEDEAGEFIRADCRAHGIDTRQLHACRDAPTSYTDAVGFRQLLFPL
jgi:sugar/nucleoside kinase (ribokinase family)